jgi:ribonuclease Z
MYRLGCLPPTFDGVLVVCRALSHTSRHHCTASPTLGHERITEPIDLRNYTGAQIKTLTKELPSCRNTPTHISVLGTGGNELSPALILKCYSRCYRFNLGEGMMRMMTSHRFRDVSKNPLSLFTRAHWENCGGAMQIYEMQEDHHGKQEYMGPGKMQQFIHYVQCYTGLLTWTRLQMKAADDGVHQFQDENLTISMIPLDAMDNATASSTVVAYACKMCDVRGKFSPEKATALGIPSGSVFKILALGHSVITEQGNLVHPSQVMGEGRKGPTFLVVDCPTSSFCSTLVSNPYLQSDHYKKRGEDVALVVHITPLDVLQSESYCQWMSGFGGDTQHLLLHSTLCPGEMGYRHSTKFNMALHMLNPKVYPFPCLPANNTLDKSNLNVSKYISKDSIVLGRMFLKFHLNPATGVDTEGCLNDLEKHLKSDLKAIKGSAIYRKILDHRRVQCDGDSVEARTVTPSLGKTEHSVRPANFDDAVVTMLGTSASYPEKYRNCSGVLIQTLQDGNYLLDCGEGTLQQLYRCFGRNETSKILRAMNVIFISHAHPDHHMGLLSILNEIDALTKNNSNCRVVSSFGIDPVLRQLHLVDPVKFTRSPYSCSEAVSMEMVPVKHIPRSFGCVLRRKGRWSIVYSGDTAPARSLVQAGHNATLLIHEATFPDSMKEEARKRRHCTYSDARRIALAMNAEFTITTHFSTRGWWLPMFRGNMVQRMIPAVDFMTVRLSDLHEQLLDSPTTFATLCALHPVNR